MESRERWRSRLTDFLPGFLAGHPVLAECADEADVLLHGSTTLGVDDAWSDLDVWLLLPDAPLRALDARAGTRFFEFELEDKPGHCNAEPRASFAERVRRCDLPLIAELRLAVPLAPVGSDTGRLLEAARRPMREPVRRAWFQHHFVEFMSERRATLTPARRRQALPLLHFSTLAVAHALRAALVLDGEPYPYAKWLAQAARATPNGAAVEACAARLVERLGEDALRSGPDSDDHPVRLTLAELKQALTDAARAAGIEGPWLDAWWLHIHPSRRGVQDVTW